MFKKQKVSFKSKDVFETKFKTNIDACFCIVSKLLFTNILNIDGSINPESANVVQKYELWSYIYYLYYFNNKNITEFADMKNSRTNKAMATKFYDVVMQTVDAKKAASNPDTVVPFNKDTLIYFVNIIVHKYEASLTNPVTEYLNKMLQKEIIPTLGSLSIKTGNSGNNVKVVTNAKNVANSNVKVRFSLKEK